MTKISIIFTEDEEREILNSFGYSSFYIPYSIVGHAGATDSDVTKIWLKSMDDEPREFQPIEAYKPYKSETIINNIIKKRLLNLLT